MLTVSNQGPSASSEVLLTYDIDPGMRLVSAHPSQGVASGAGTVLWDIGTLAAGQAAYLDVGVVVEEQGSLVNQAEVTAHEDDPDLSNNVHGGVTSIRGGYRSPEGQAVYGTPEILDPPADPDQNRVGESLDFDANGGATRPIARCTYGVEVGQVYFNYDGTNLYVGGHELEMLGDVDRFIIFLGLNTLPDDFHNSADKVGAPVSLNLLDNLFLEQPMDLAIVLGDEYGDGTDPSAGHGVFRLGGTGFQPVLESRLAQFDGSRFEPTLPTSSPDDDGDRLTDRWEASIPWSTLNAPSGIVSVTSLRVAGVIVGDAVGTNRYIYGSYLGFSAEGISNLDGDFGFNGVTLRAATVGLPDRDGDGLPDWWETLHGLDPDDDGSIDLDNGPDGDPDGDGSTNAEEKGAGTDPRDAGSLFIVSDLAVNLSGASVTVLTQPGQRYEIEYRDGGMSGPAAWTPFVNGTEGVGTWIEDAAGPTNFTFVDDFTPATSGMSPTGTSTRVYRVNTEEQ